MMMMMTKREENKEAEKFPRSVDLRHNHRTANQSLRRREKYYWQMVNNGDDDDHHYYQNSKRDGTRQQRIVAQPNQPSVKCGIFFNVQRLMVSPHLVLTLSFRFIRSSSFSIIGILVQLCNVVVLGIFDYFI